MSLINRKTPTQATKETGNIGNKRNESAKYFRKITWTRRGQALVCPQKK